MNDLPTKWRFKKKWGCNKVGDEVTVEWVNLNWHGQVRGHITSGLASWTVHPTLFYHKHNKTFSECALEPIK